MRVVGLWGVWVGGVLLLGGPALATPPSDVADLVGVKGRDGEAELQNRGYEFHHGAEAPDGKITFWKNAATKTCLQVLTKDGRYASVENAPAGSCEAEPQ
jgi:hypothetical protein